MLVGNDDAVTGKAIGRLRIEDMRAFARWVLAVTEPKRSKKTGERGR